jgi:ATP-dependent DNA helicase RecG
MSIEELYDPNHSSKPRNRLIAQVFNDIKLIEKYGSCIQRILTECAKVGIPAPSFEEKFGGFLVTFRKDIYTEDHLKAMGLNERQIKAVVFTKKNGKITNKQYQEITGIQKRQATVDLQDMENKGILTKVGKTVEEPFTP